MVRDVGGDGARGRGPFGETCAVAADDVVPLDGAVADEDAAAIGTSGIAAWMCLTWRAGLQPGERVLVLGAGGTVGQAAVAAARSLGAARVVAVCRSAAAETRATRAGADEVVRVVEDETADPAAQAGEDRVGRGRSGGRRRRPGVRAVGGRRVPRPGLRWSAGQPRRPGWRRRAAVVGGVAGPLGERARVHQQRDHPGPAGGGARGGAEARPRLRPGRSWWTIASTPEERGVRLGGSGAQRRRPPAGPDRLTGC